MDNCVRISKTLRNNRYLCKIDNEAVTINRESIEVLYMMWGIDIVQETDTHYLVQLPEGWSYTEFIYQGDPGYKILDDKGRVRIYDTENWIHPCARYYVKYLPIYACKYLDFRNLDCSNLKNGDWIAVILEPPRKVVEIIATIKYDGTNNTRQLQSNASLYLNEHYPDIYYLNAYWD